MAKNRGKIVCASCGHAKTRRKMANENLGSKSELDKFYSIMTALSRRDDLWNKQLLMIAQGEVHIYTLIAINHAR